MTKAPIATPGVSRQIRPNTIPKIPRKPTAHQLSARTSLSASQRSLVAAGLLFPDPVLAAMGEPPSIALQRQDIVPDESTRGKYAAISTGKARQIPHESVLEAVCDLYRNRGNGLPQPDMAGIVIEARMPQQRDGQTRQFDRRGTGRKLKGFGEIARKPEWHGRDQRCARHHEGHGEEARRDQGDGSLQLELGKRLIDSSMRVVA